MSSKGLRNWGLKCPHCTNLFYNRKNRRCPICSVKLVGKGEFFEVNASEVIYIMHKDKWHKYDENKGTTK